MSENNHPTGSELSANGEQDHFINSIYLALAWQGIDPHRIIAGRDIPNPVDPDGPHGLLFGIPDAKAGVSIPGKPYSDYANAGWAVVVVNAKQMQAFHRVMQSLTSLASSALTPSNTAPSHGAESQSPDATDLPDPNTHDNEERRS